MAKTEVPSTAELKQYHKLIKDTLPAIVADEQKNPLQKPVPTAKQRKAANND